MTEKTKKEKLAILISTIREEFNWLQGCFEDAYSQIDSLEYVLGDLEEFSQEK